MLSRLAHAVALAFAIQFLLLSGGAKAQDSSLDATLDILADGGDRFLLLGNEDGLGTAADSDLQRDEA